ncbi:hypothetical protein CAPTEDRAFT_115381, partial [Capitella teleta]
VSDPCLMPKVIRNCRARLPRFYFDNQKGKCKKFYYGGCGGNENRFDSKSECKKTCMKRMSCLMVFAHKAGQ